MKKTMLTAFTILLTAFLAIPLTACDFNSGRLGNPSNQDGKYTVTFMSDSVKYITTKVKPGECADLPPGPIQIDRTFVGWSLTQDSYNPFYAEYPILGDFELYAYFVKKSVNTYTVTFDTNGANESVAPIKSAEASFYPPWVNLTKEGELFYGWSAEKNNPETAAAHYIGVSGGNKTYYALWAKTTDENYVNYLLLNALLNTAREAIGFEKAQDTENSGVYKELGDTLYTVTSELYAAQIETGLIREGWFHNNNFYTHNIAEKTYTYKKDHQIDSVGIFFRSALQKFTSANFILKQETNDTYITSGYEITVKDGKITKADGIFDSSGSGWFYNTEKYNFYYSGETVPIPPFPDYDWVLQE